MHSWSGTCSLAVDRFKASDDEQRASFREKLSGYVKVYAFLSQILPYGDPNLEMLYSFSTPTA